MKKKMLLPTKNMKSLKLLADAIAEGYYNAITYNGHFNCNASGHAKHV